MPMSKNRTSERRPRKYGEDAELLVRTPSSESGVTTPAGHQNFDSWRHIWSMQVERVGISTRGTDHPTDVIPHSEMLYEFALAMSSPS